MDSTEELVIPKSLYDEICSVCDNPSEFCAECVERFISRFP